MKTALLVSLASVACTAIALAAENSETSGQFEGYPKNLARQHMGANLLQYNASTHTYTPTQAAAAWLDDDVTTGWPLMAEKQFYLLTLPKAEMLTNFALSTRPSSGTVSVYASDTPGAPGASTWAPLLKDVPLDTVNQKLSRAFARLAKYVLIETEVPDPGPVYSLYLYSHKPAVSYEVQKRTQAIEPKAIFGPYVNEATSFNVSGLYAHGYVSQSSGNSDMVGWQKAIDDNPETSIVVAPTTDQPTVIRYDQPRSISRVALLTDPGAKGKVDLYLVNNHEASIEGATPTMSMVLDGSTPRVSVDFPATEASELRMKWVPANGTDSLTVREVNSFGGTTLSEYAVNTTPGSPDAIADGEESSTKSKSDGKTMGDGKDAKEAIASGPPGGPYLPGALGFPPNINTRGFVLPRSTPTPLSSGGPVGL